MIEIENKISDIDFYDAEFHRINAEKQAFIKKILSYPFKMLTYLWTEKTIKDTIFGEKYVDMLNQLIKNGFFLHNHVAFRDLMEISEFACIPPNVVIDNIRCNQEWSIDKREDYVKFYTEFTGWLSRQTFDIIRKAKDYDRIVTQQRFLPFDTYIEILKNLAINERVMAKLFYLGGSIRLEDILSLQIDHVNFREKSIYFSDSYIFFPPHVFKDIEYIIGDRKIGYVFSGKKGKPINHTIHYRNLKKVLERLCLPKHYTFRTFTRNK